MPEEVSTITDQVMSTVSKLAQLLYTDQDQASDAAMRFKQELYTLIDSMGEDNFCTDFNEAVLGYSLTFLIDSASFGNSFMVDWKDTESALYWLDEALKQESVEIDLDYGVSDPENELDVHQIFVRANLQLNTIGYSLLGFDTGGDCYIEILLKTAVVDSFIHIAQEINIQMDLNEVEESWGEE